MPLHPWPPTATAPPSTGTPAPLPVRTMAAPLAFGGFLVAAAVLTGTGGSLAGAESILVLGAILLAAARALSVLMAVYLGVVAAAVHDFFFVRPFGVLHLERGSALLVSLAFVALGLLGHASGHPWLDRGGRFGE